MSDTASAQRLETLFTKLIQAQERTNDQLTKLATAQTQAASAVAPPAPAPTATTTQVGAINKEGPLNVLDTAKNITVIIPEQWIIHALSLLQGEAAVWAVHYLQDIEAHATTRAAAATAAAASQPPVTITPFPFNGQWDEFVKAFKAHFMASDDNTEAQRELESITQGNKTVAQRSPDARTTPHRT
ncbi:hypothetical protein D9611_015162 [Ephemerocybe angulata]|uniref:Retrotransposon gag domain-containing protein n=1 Tax=Ephemerocybe angulata TaxID=980116 RepID=A0A8H5FI62_9AGAR|nr:hypothetical protein D9611_014947 [Tulosesus angulatus]KAF5337691.1 hypothetical protein D9611_015162 [Tulosesus angulatus]